MNKSKAYQSIAVNAVNVESLSLEACGDSWLGLDVGKFHVYGVLRHQSGNFERPWRIEAPAQIRMLVDLCRQMQQGGELKVALEASGSYTEPLRQALCQAGLPLFRVSTKATHDYAEIFDGTPSKHDGKDAAIIAELAAQGKADRWPWQPPPEWVGQLQEEVRWYRDQRRLANVWAGRLEGLLAQYWPELTGVLPLKRVSLCRLLIEFGGPKPLSEDPRADPLQHCCARLGASRRAQILQSATSTLGVPQSAAQLQSVQRTARMRLEALQQCTASRNVLGSLCAQQEVLGSMAQVVGPLCASVLFAALGDPNRYHCAAAWRKALGLNLKERSSGTCKGQVKLTKRGPATARHQLYLTALRLCRDPQVCHSYQRHKARKGGRSGPVLVTLMRRLAIATYRVAVQGQSFDPGRLFARQGTAQGE